MKSETFLEDAQNDLKNILQPFQKELNAKQRMADFLKQCIRYVQKDDFLQLDEMLKDKIILHIEKEQDLVESVKIFETLRAYASEKVERYRLQFIEDLIQLAMDADIEIEIDFPKFSSLKGIKGEIEFNQRYTTINRKSLKSIDPRRIISSLVKLKRQLYGQTYDPQNFINSVFKAYSKIVKDENKEIGDVVPIQKFYLEYVISIQNKSFFQNMEKGKFKGYSVEQFSVDLWRYFESSVEATSDNYKIKLHPGRNKSLWLIDVNGEDRQITGISFQE